MLMPKLTVHDHGICVTSLGGWSESLAMGRVSNWLQAGLLGRLLILAITVGRLDRLVPFYR